ncbi:3-deoxy-D-manno-octulosonic acid transferase [Leptospira sp. GIMC2001]|uniref:3-deoxy-D-manno-octulosonic acid transferase n=1 Tax=Leptospira sp. GIMC2001 TaxID=1513297 RepID=UPI00234B8569|nr:glycosyltransferase N-terminal domain-containing protein [Leptospira sp. GIMC2001]WCL48432.1 hypothetical protein O4O04_14120 [Leptospira sp. GIMC2001]
MGYLIFLIYTPITFIAKFLFWIASLVSKRARNFRRQRLDAIQILKTIEVPKNSTAYWFHGASVGELDQAKSLARECKNREPNCFIMLTWVSDSVTDKNLSDSPANINLPLPLDSPFSYNLYFDKLKPKHLLLFTWDTWSWLIRSAYNRKIPISLVCATLGEKSGRKGFFSRALTMQVFSWLFGIYTAHSIFIDKFEKLLELKVDTNTEKILLNGKSIFLKNLGDTRFDAVIQKIQNSNEPEKFTKFLDTIEVSSSNNQAIIFASTYSVCESGIIDWISTIEIKDSKCIWIFPHKIDIHRIEKLHEDCKKLGWTVCKFSQPVAKAKIILFDELGILAFAYKYGLISYVGGGFHHRIHNTIEPAYFGLPILTGPRIYNSPEALVMQSKGGLISIDSPKDLKIQIHHLLSNPKRLMEIQKINQNFVLDNKGASQRIYEEVLV